MLIHNASLYATVPREALVEGLTLAKRHVVGTLAGSIPYCTKSTYMLSGPNANLSRILIPHILIQQPDGVCTRHSNDQYRYYTGRWVRYRSVQHNTSRAWVRYCAKQRRATWGQADNIVVTYCIVCISTRKRYEIDNALTERWTQGYGSVSL